MIKQLCAAACILESLVLDLIGVKTFFTLLKTSIMNSMNVYEFAIKIYFVSAFTV